MKPQLIELDVDQAGSQDPADQPTGEELAALSRYFQEQKQRRAAEATKAQAVSVMEKVTQTQAA